MDNMKKCVITCLRILKEQAGVWDAVCSKCEAYLVAIGNVTQQVKCCRRAKLHLTPVNETQFPDVKDHLLTKLYIEGNKALLVLRGKLEELQSCCDRISATSRKAVSALQANSSSPDVYVWTATEPPISDVVLWVCNAAAVATQQLAEKRTLLDSIEFDAEGELVVDSVTGIDRRWKSHKKLTLLFSDIFDLCSFISLE